MYKPLDPSPISTPPNFSTAVGSFITNVELASSFDTSVEGHDERGEEAEEEALAEESLLAMDGAQWVWRILPSGDSGGVVIDDGRDHVSTSIASLFCSMQERRSVYSKKLL